MRIAYLTLAGSAFSVVTLVVLLWIQLRYHRAQKRINDVLMKHIAALETSRDAEDAP